MASRWRGGAHACGPGTGALRHALGAALDPVAPAPVSAADHGRRGAAQRRLVGVRTGADPGRAGRRADHRSVVVGSAGGGPAGGGPAGGVSVAAGGAARRRLPVHGGQRLHADPRPPHRAGCARRALSQPARQEPDLPRPAAHRRSGRPRHRRLADAVDDGPSGHPLRERHGDGLHHADCLHPAAGRRAARGAGALRDLLRDHPAGVRPPPGAGAVRAAPSAGGADRDAGGGAQRHRGGQGVGAGGVRARALRAHGERLQGAVRTVQPDRGLLHPDADLRRAGRDGAAARRAGAAARRDRAGRPDRLRRADARAAHPHVHLRVLLLPAAGRHRRRAAHPGRAEGGRRHRREPRRRQRPDRGRDLLPRSRLRL